MSTAVGFASAMSLEGVGFSAFHIALERREWWAKIPAVAYLFIGTSALIFIKGGDAMLGIIMFGLVALAYMTDSMRRSTRERKAAELEERQRRLAERNEARKLDAELLRKDKEDEQELKLARLAAQKEIKMLETSQNVRESSPPPAETFQKVPETFPRDSRHFQPQHWEKLRGMVAVMTEAEVATELGVTTKTVQNWKRKM
jgi:DNA-binding transcriptional regulator YiaG